MPETRKGDNTQTVRQQILLDPETRRLLDVVRKTRGLSTFSDTIRLLIRDEARRLGLAAAESPSTEIPDGGS
jgi:hypothetical protein